MSNRYLDRFLKMRCSGDVINVIGWNPKKLAAALAVRQAAKQIIMERKRKGQPCTVYAYDDPLLAAVMAFTLPAPVVLVAKTGDVPFKLDGVRNLVVVGSDYAAGDLGEHPEGIVVSSRVGKAIGAVGFAMEFRFIDGLAARCDRQCTVGGAAYLDETPYLAGVLDTRYPYAAVKVRNERAVSPGMVVLTMDNWGEVT